MTECSRRSGFPFVKLGGPPERSASRATGWLSSVLLASAVLALFMASPARADDPPPPPPPCPDADADGYVQCTAACTTPADKLCGDCDDGDAAIFLRAVCAVCNGPGCPASFCIPGSTARPCPAGGGDRTELTGFCLSVSADTDFVCSNDPARSCVSSADCLAGGVCVPVVVPDPTRGLVCDDAGAGDACISPPHVVPFQAEGGSTLTDPQRLAAPSCSDTVDNDCDGLVDLADPQCQTAEICDGRDNDGDGTVDEGFGIGSPCTAGSGACQASGTTVCSADGSGTVCNAVPKAPGVEGPFGSPKCSDGLDNDCDELIDFPADSSCTRSELCDGLDDDGDGDVDEDFDVGASCTAGLSSCQTTGQKVCASSGLGTICNAVAKLGSLEGPSRPGSCTDGVDNDCDGFTDAADGSCGTVGLRATCALPFWDAPARGGSGPGRDCDSTHIIVFDEPDGIEVTGELVALSPEGTVLGAIPVQNGDLAHLVSRTGPEDLQLRTEIVGVRTTHHVFGPMPMLRVTASDGVQKATAYCSTIPYLEVTKPTGGVLALNQSASGGQPDVTPVVVALPRVAPNTMSVLVDGVNLFSALDKKPSECTVATPCNGNIHVGNDTVHVRDLIVDVAPELEDEASNSLTMTLEGLGCGGHLVRATGEKIKGSIPDRVHRRCLVDEVRDEGASYTFAIEITAPAHRSAGNPVPTPVRGRVCHGLPFQSILLNGREIFDPGLLTMTPAADLPPTFEFPIDERVGQTNVARDVVFGDHPAGTFDPGSNFVQVSATDAMGNRAFHNAVVFGTELTAQPGVGALSAQGTSYTQALDPQVKAALENELAGRLHDAFKDLAIDASSTIDVPSAFVVALDGQALTNFFAEKCSGPGPDGKTLQQRFQELADSKIRGRQFGPFSAPFPCSCDPSVTLTVNTVQFLSNVACPVLFPGQTDPDGNVVPPDTIRVVIRLPDIRARVSGSDSCRDTFLGVCIASASASISLDAEVKNIRLKFDITEGQLEGTVPPTPASFNAGVAATVDGSLSVHTDVGCIGGDICEALVSIFTFGLIDVTPNIEIDRAIEFAREIGQAEPDPVRIKDFRPGREEIANFGVGMIGDLLDVNISNQGIRAAVTARFSTNHVDPEIVANPGIILEMPPTPELPLPASLGTADDGAVLINADSINMLFAGLTISGRLKSECNVSLDPHTGEPRTLGSLLPADCNTLNGPNDTATALGRGFCHGLRESACETLLGPGLLFTPIEQGICHGLQGHDCALIPAGFLGTALPADCETLAIGSGDSDDPSRATAIAQGRCWALRGADCETLTTPGGTANDTAVKQGACHGQKGDVCTDIPTAFGRAAREIGTCAAVQGTPCGTLGLGPSTQCTVSKIQINVVEALLRTLEQQGCNLTPSLNVNANQPLLFCARQDLPPRFLIRDDPESDPVEVGLRLNDLSLAVVVDRNQDEVLNGQLSSTPRCFGEGSVPSGDCTLAALCLDLNFVASFEFAGAGECLAEGGVVKPGFRARILDVQSLSRLFGHVCGGLPAGDDVTVVNESTANNASIDAVRVSADSFSPPACIEGLTMGGIVTFENPTIFALRTGAPKSVCENDPTISCTSSAQCGGGTCVPIQNFIGISTRIVP